MDKDLERAYHESGLNLSLVPLHDLLDEVKRRCDTCIFVGDQRLESTEEYQKGIYTTALKGAAVSVLGLLHATILVVEDSAREALMPEEAE